MKNFFFLTVMFLGLYACSNEEISESQQNGEEVESLKILTGNDIPEEYRKISAEAGPYISPAMQELLNQLSNEDNIENVYSLLESSGYITNTVENSQKEPEASTRITIDTTGEFTLTNVGFDLETLFKGQSVDLYYDMSFSPLRTSLNYNARFTNNNNEKSYFACEALSIDVLFTKHISYIKASFNEGDYMAIHPERVPANNKFTNETYLDKGFVISPLVEGQYYRFTTYAFVFTDVDTSKNYARIGSWTPVFDRNRTDATSYNRDLIWRFTAI